MRVQDLIARSPKSDCSFSWRYSTKRVLPEKQCGTEKEPPERLARPISQARTEIAVQPEASVLVSSRAPQKMVVKQGFRAQARAPILVRDDDVIGGGGGGISPGGAVGGGFSTLGRGVLENGLIKAFSFFTFELPQAL